MAAFLPVPILICDALHQAHSPPASHQRTGREGELEGVTFRRLALENGSQSTKGINPPDSLSLKSKLQASRVDLSIYLSQKPFAADTENRVKPKRSESLAWVNREYCSPIILDPHQQPCRYSAAATTTNLNPNNLKQA